jgi:plasmid stabilization system protein ParE
VKRSFILTPEAKADLREILIDIAEDRPETAERLRFELYKGFQRLGRSPGIGHYREDLLDRRYRFRNFYSYVACYEWEPKPARIVAAGHGARHLASFFDARQG